MRHAETKDWDAPPLTPEEEAVIVRKGTEPPFSGRYDRFDESGLYRCRRCDAPLYRSDDKFNAGCGWPSFDDEIPGAVKRMPDADGRRTEILCARCDGHLGHVFEGERLTPKNTRHCVNSLSLRFEAEPEPADRSATRANANTPAESALATFAAGCFWGVEHLFAQREGVRAVVSGYTGGTTEQPAYEDVCSGGTGHLEAVQVEYDPARVGYRDLVRYFFEMHDPTQRNGQGPDIGEQYGSAIFYRTDEEKRIAQETIAQLERQGLAIATRLIPAAVFWKAEEWHQRYYRKKGGQPYCHVWRKRFIDQPEKAGPEGKRLLAALAFLMAGLMAGAAPVFADEPPAIEVRSPYAGVDWKNVRPHRANLHTHTSASGGPHAPAEMIAAYRGRGYTVLALTDHNRLTWPWDRYGMPPDALGMLAVRGAELIRHHHLGSYFSDYTGGADTLEEKLEAIGKAGGLAVLFHPGRYRRHPDWTPAWHARLYRDHDALVGMEVFNKGNRYPTDLALWDELLGELMPDRPVWGFANDDAYVMSEVGRTWQTFFLEALTEEQARAAMRAGRFVFSLSPQGRAPTVTSIETDREAGTIRVRGDNFRRVIWTANGKDAHEGEQLAVGGLPPETRYVRARLESDEGATYTQPFGLVRPRP